MQIDSYLDRFEAVKVILSTHFQKFHLNEERLERFADAIEDSASVILFVDTLTKQNHPPAKDQEDLKWIASQLLRISKKLEEIGLVGEHALNECGSTVASCGNEISNLRAKIQAAANLSGKLEGSPTALALELPTAQKSKGKPTNQVQNEMALVLARIFRETTGRLPTITVDATTNPPARKGKYLALVREVFDVYGFTPANATSSGTRAVEQIKTE